MRKTTFIIIIFVILLLNNCADLPAYRTSDHYDSREYRFQISQLEREIESLKSFQFDAKMAINALNDAVRKIAEKQYELEERVWLTEAASGVVDADTANPPPTKLMLYLNDI